MKFGAIDTQYALGAILAHSLALKTGRIRKGHVITSADIVALLDAGHEKIVVAQLSDQDIDENSAAQQLAYALAGAGLRISQAATGRVNIFATAPGVACIDAVAIHAFNKVNPMITVATLAPFQRVSRGTMVATIKIISYGVARQDVMQAMNVAKAALCVKPPVYKTATLIETQTERLPNDKGRNSLSGRLDRLGLNLTPDIIVPHDAQSLAGAIREAKGDVVFILTASATSDIDDVGPTALRDAGGCVSQFGIPVDPGNLLFLGDFGTKPVIGLPGCARSPALNGADWVLERVLCGITLTADDFATMGVGGLLKEIPTRPQPRADI